MEGNDAGGCGGGGGGDRKRMSERECVFLREREAARKGESL